MSASDDPTEEFDLEFDLGIDWNELDGLTPQEVFVLGGEFADVWRDLCAAKEMSAGVVLTWTIHVSNVYRCKRACVHHGFAPLSCPVDGSGWMVLEARINE